MELSYILQLFFILLAATALAIVERSTDTLVKSKFVPPELARVDPSQFANNKPYAESKVYSVLHLDERPTISHTTTLRAIQSESLMATPTSKPLIHILSTISWIKEYFAFQTKQDKSQIKTPATHTAVALGSKIRTYEKLQSDPTQLKEWTRYVVEQSRLNNDIMSKPPVKNRLDIPRFINYLVNEQGFKLNDLDFLTLADLDYGFEEIEKELNKIKEREKKDNKFIDIGGETSTKNHATVSLLDQNLLIISFMIYLLSYAGIF